MTNLLQLLPSGLPNTRRISTIIDALLNSDSSEQAVDSISAASVELVQQTKADLLDQLRYRVGDIYITLNPEDPATALGYGTWELWGSGKMIVGQDPNDVDFDTAEETGGQKTVTLTENEIPSHSHHVTVDSAGSHNHSAGSAAAGGHTHVLDSAGSHSHSASAGASGAHGHSVYDQHVISSPNSYSHTGGGGWTFESLGTRSTSSVGNHSHTISIQSGGSHDHTLYSVDDHAHAIGVNPSGSHTHTASASNTGGDSAHENMPPYIVAYMWKRIS